MVYCISCGNELKSSAKFCPRCGAKAPDDGGRADRAAALVERMQAGDNSAFDEFYAEFYKYVKFVAARLVGSEAAEDVAQEAFLNLYNKVDTIRNPQAALAWLRQTTTNAAKNLLLKEKKYVLEDDGADGDDRQSVFDTLEEDDSVLIPESALESDEMRELIKGFISELTPSQQLVLERKYFDGLETKEISAETGMPVNTVNTNLRRGKLRLKKNIEEYSKMTGQKLYSIPFAYLLWMLFRNMLLETAVPESMPGVLASAAAAAQAAAQSSAHSAVGSLAGNVAGEAASSTAQSSAHSTVGAFSGSSAGEAQAAASTAAGSSAHSTVGALTGTVAGETETAAAGGAAEGTAGTAARTTVKAAGMSVKAKVAAGVIAAVIGVGGVGAVVTVMNRPAENDTVSGVEYDTEDDTKEITEEESAEDESVAEEIIVEETEKKYVLSSTTDYDADGAETSFTEYYYDGDWLCTGYGTTDADGSESEVEYVYTFYDDGTIMTKEWTSGDDCFVYSYDEDGGLLGHTLKYTVDSGTYYYEYDSEGYVIVEQNEHSSELSYSVYYATYEYEFYDDGSLKSVSLEQNREWTADENTMDNPFLMDDLPWLEIYFDEDGTLVSWYSDEMGEYTAHFTESGTDMICSEDYDTHDTHVGSITYYADGTVVLDLDEGYEWGSYSMGYYLWPVNKSTYPFNSINEYDDDGNLIKTTKYNYYDEILGWTENEWQAVE